MFNAARLWELAQQGTITAKLDKNSHCEPPIPCHPHCTHSQRVKYYDASGERIAVVHQYMKPDGSLGGSGKPDPKFLVQGGIEYIVELPAEHEERRIPCNQSAES